MEYTGKLAKIKAVPPRPIYSIQCSYFLSQSVFRILICLTASGSDTTNFRSISICISYFLISIVATNYPGPKIIVSRSRCTKNTDLSSSNCVCVKNICSVSWDWDFCENIADRKMHYVPRTGRGILQLIFTGRAQSRRSLWCSLSGLLTDYAHCT